MDITKYIGETTEYDKKQEVERRKVKSWLKSIITFPNIIEIWKELHGDVEIHYVESGTQGVPQGNTGKFTPTNMVYWQKDERLSKYKILPGDLVISLTGTVGKSDYGNVCILGNDYEEYYLNQRNAKLEVGENLNKHYLTYLLKQDIVKGKLTRISRGIRQANIANRDIENLQIPLPPLPLQQLFSRRIEQIEHQKAEVQKAITDLETLLASRMQYWFE